MADTLQICGPALPRPIDHTWEVALLYLPLVKRIARSFHVSQFDRDDLVQEGIIAAWRAIPKVDASRGKLKSLIAAAVQNQMRDWLRWRHRDRRATGDVTSARGRADRIDATDLADALDAIEHLPARPRSIVREHFGLRGPARTGAVIAAALGMKRDAVARAQFRAMVRVRERLGAAARGPEAARPPCVICGDPDGTIPRSRRTPERLSLARFGLKGVACRRCYIRLYARERVRKRIGVAS